MGFELCKCVGFGWGKFLFACIAYFEPSVEDDKIWLYKKEISYSSITRLR